MSFPADFCRAREHMTMRHGQNQTHTQQRAQNQLTRNYQTAEFKWCLSSLQETKTQGGEDHRVSWWETPGPLLGSFTLHSVVSLLQYFYFMTVHCTLHWRDTPETSAPSLCTTLIFPRVRSLRYLTHPTPTHRACPPVCPDVGGDSSEGKVRRRSGEECGLLLLASGETQVTRQEKLARPPFRSPGATSRHQHLCLPQSDTQPLCFGLNLSSLEPTVYVFVFSQELNELRKCFWKSLESGVCEPRRSVPGGFCSSFGLTIGTKVLTLSSPQIGTDSLIRVPHQTPILMGHEFLLPGKEVSCSWWDGRGQGRSVKSLACVQICSSICSQPSLQQHFLM